jgi:hypothetical protein
MKGRGQNEQESSSRTTGAAAEKLRSLVPGTPSRKVHSALNSKRMQWWQLFLFMGSSVLSQTSIPLPTLMKIVLEVFSENMCLGEDASSDKHTDTHAQDEHTDMHFNKAHPRLVHHKN